MESRVAGRAIDSQALLAKSLTWKDPDNPSSGQLDGVGQEPPVVSADLGEIPVFPPTQLRASAIPPQIAIGRVDDPLEHEASRLADQVMCMNDSVALAQLHLGPNGDAYDETSALQTKGVGPREIVPNAAPGIVHEVLRSPGEPLDGLTRAFFEPRFGFDLSKIRVHYDSRAAEAAGSVNSFGFAAGQHVVLADGRFAPHSDQGRRFLAHELAHIIQNRHLDSSSSLVLARQPARPQAVKEPAERLFTALDNNDGTGVTVAVSDLIRSRGPAELRMLVSDGEFRRKLRDKAPPLVLFAVLRRLWFPAGAPPFVHLFDDALHSRNGRLVLEILQQYPQLRDPDQVPGVYEVADKLFKDAPEYASIMKLVSWDLGEVLSIGRQSETFRGLESQARASAHHTSHEELQIVKSVPGLTTNIMGQVAVRPDVKSPENATIQLAHELANKARQIDFMSIRERRDRREFHNGRQYAEAILSIEAESVIKRAQVAVELGIRENPTVEALVRDWRAKRIDYSTVYDQVLADIIKNYRAADGRTALESYEKQYSEWEAASSKP